MDAPWQTTTFATATFIRNGSPHFLDQPGCRTQRASTEHKMFICTEVVELALFTNCQHVRCSCCRSSRLAVDCDGRGTGSPSADPTLPEDAAVAGGGAPPAKKGDSPIIRINWSSAQQEQGGGQASARDASTMHFRPANGLAVVMLPLHRHLALTPYVAMTRVSPKRNVA